MRCAAVATSAAAGTRESSPLSSSRAGPLPASASRLSTATIGFGIGGFAAKRAAPRPPNEPPSVERKTRVCVD